MQQNVFSQVHCSVQTTVNFEQAHTPPSQETTMNAISQQFVANQQTSLENILAIQNAVFEGFEKLADLNLKVFKASIDEVSQKSQEAVKIQDPQQALDFSSSLFQPGAEKVLAYSKQVYDVLSGVQIDIAKLTEAQLEQAQKQISDAIEQLSKNAPAGSEGAVALLKSSLASVNSAYESVAQSTRQAAEAAETNIAKATDATFKAASDAVEAAKPAARARRATA